MTLTEFLLARIAEDERMVTAMNLTNYPTALGAPRKARECEAKRRIVEWCSGETASEWHEGPVLGMLAAVYADHPDYRQEWRP